jgi:hypothetical protein
MCLFLEYPVGPFVCTLGERVLWAYAAQPMSQQWCEFS